MRKLILGSICVVLLASCNVKNSDEYKALQAERDSLANLKGQSDVELKDMQSLIDEVQDNFEQIRAAEKYLSVEARSQGEMAPDARTKIQENFKMINDILKKNKDNLAAINSKLATSKGDNTAMKKLVENLNNELKERAATITELQAALASRDQEIAKLADDVKSLNSSVQDLSNKSAEQASKIKEQDKALNTAYYIFGTTSELKDAQLVKGGFLVSSKLLQESVDKEKFIRIDMRNVKEIPVYAKKAKVLSNHPQSSYSLVKDSNGQQVVKINDYQKFWSLTSFLVVEVN